METIKEAVRAIRNVRTSMNVPPSKKAKVYVVSNDEALLGIFEHSKVFFATLGYASEVYLQKDKEGIARRCSFSSHPQRCNYMPFAELVEPFTKFHGDEPPFFLAHLSRTARIDATNRSIQFDNQQ